MINISVPATTANLGPGFDCLGLALNIWNEVSFEPAEGLTYQVTGEGAEKFNKTPKNILTRAILHLYDLCGREFPGSRIQAHNQIWVGSGLGSSAAAIVAGLFGANEQLGNPLNQQELLKLAAELEGHPDNVAPALLGGLVVSVKTEDEIIVQRYEIPELTIVIVKPNVEWPTRAARAVLPRSVSRTDAVFNLGRTPLVVNALREGDLPLLQKIMEDRIHQPYRLKHISGGMEAYQVARQFGAAALSGAGPSIINFVRPELANRAQAEMISVFEKRRIEAVGCLTKPTPLGTHRV